MDKFEQLKKSLEFVGGTITMIDNALSHKDEPYDDYIFYLEKAKEALESAISEIKRS